MSSRLEDLEPITRSLCYRFLSAATAAGHAIRVTHTLRTMDEQAHLFAKGRTLPGHVVTMAGPGSSPHNWGAAFDICFAGDDPFGESHPWEAVGLLGEGVGLTWGGRFHSMKDRPHFERKDWRTLRSSAQGGSA